MKIKNPNNSLKKTLLTTLVIIISLVGIYTALAYSQQLWPFSEPETTVGSPDADKPVGEATSTDDKADPTANTPVQYGPSDGSKTQKDKLTGLINYKSIVDDKLIIRTTINQFTGSGACALTLVSNDSGKTVTRTADIINNPSSSSCDGFTIPVSELNPGKWTITIDMSSEDKQGTLESTIDI